MRMFRKMRREEKMAVGEETEGNEIQDGYVMEEATTR
jgi:hypothetical protein